MGVYEVRVTWCEDACEVYEEAYPVETLDEAYRKVHELEKYLEGEDVIIYITKRGTWYNV